MWSVIVRIVANLPSANNFASSGACGGVATFAITRGVRGAEGARDGFGFGFAVALALDAVLAAVFRAAALRAGEEGFARPERPRR